MVVKFRPVVFHQLAVGIYLVLICSEVYFGATCKLVTISEILEPGYLSSSSDFLALLSRSTTVRCFLFTLSCSSYSVNPQLAIETPWKHCAAVSVLLGITGAMYHSHPNWDRDPG